MRVLIIGGTNFIGPAAVRRLVARGLDVTVFHRGKSNAPLPDSVKHILGDRANLDDFASEFLSLAPDVVLDMGAYTQEAGESLIRVFRGITRRLVVISSVDVYRAFDRFRRADPGAPDSAPLTEDSPLRDKLFPYRSENTSPDQFFYSYDKILMEHAAMSAPENLPATVVRLPFVYGHGDYQHRLFSYLKRMDDKRPAILLGAEQAQLRFCRGFVEDMGEAIALCVADDRAANRIYHVAEEANATELEWVTRIAKAAQWTGEIVTLPEADMPERLKSGADASQSLALDSSRIRAELGYREVTSPEDALSQTVAWERANPPKTFDESAFDYAAEDAALGESRT
jgi:nucleoside-diphosphate-sugar epimerase